MIVLHQESAQMKHAFAVNSHPDTTLLSKTLRGDIRVPLETRRLRGRLHPAPLFGSGERHPWHRSRCTGPLVAAARLVYRLPSHSNRPRFCATLISQYLMSHRPRDSTAGHSRAHNGRQRVECGRFQQPCHPAREAWCARCARQLRWCVAPLLAARRHPCVHRWCVATARDRLQTSTPSLRSAPIAT